MVYIDTSVLVSYYCLEPLSEAAEKIILIFVKYRKAQSALRKATRRK